MKTEAKQITAVILAGGKGRRLEGNDKGLVLFRSKPMIEHIIEAISPQVGEVLINANRNQETYASYGKPVFSDELSDFQGPLAGFSSAMAQANTEFILTLPCDGPFIADDYVTRLSAALNNNDAELAIAHDGERMQPVHALIPVSLKRSLDAFLQSGDRKIDRWYAQHHYALADFADRPEIFRNINTPEQLQDLEEQEQKNG